MSYIDARRYDGPADLSCDICIAGAGAAGITLALALARTGRRIILLESGGLAYDGDTQALQYGKQTGVPYFDLISCRLRYFGGSTSHYGGFCATPRPVDYLPRPELGLPGWPIGYDDLIGYFRKASRQLGIDPEQLLNPAAPGNDLGAAGSAMIEHQSKLLCTGMQIQSLQHTRKFNPRYVDEVGALPGTDVFLYANLTHIGLAENGRTLNSFTVKTLTGKSMTIRPKVGVLACHAIEIARLLLASNDVLPAGIGNRGDQLGRHFMDHIHVRSGRIVPDPKRLPPRYAHDYLMPEARRAHWSEIQLTDEARLKYNMLHYACVLEPHYPAEDDLTGTAISRLIKGFFHPFEDQMAEDVGTMLGHPASSAGSTLARFGLRGRKPLYYHFVQHIEQWPNPESRITLLPERDVLGVPVVNLNYALGEPDFHTLARGQELVAQELSALGWGRVSVTPLTPDYIKRNVLGVWHNMGTTRMSDFPQAGVVDRNCKVYGTDNLYIAGSSVFPNATKAWPTIQLLALTYRLAEHLEPEIWS